MKSLKYITLITLGSLAVSCEQEFKTFTNDPCDGSDPSIICHPEQVPDCPAGASKGSADFTKFVAIGSSFTAGFQAGALFTDGQNASIPALLASKFACVGGPATFNQPTIGTAGGFNIFVTPNPVGGTTVLGRFRLQGTPPAPAPIISDAAAIPDPQVNPGFVYTGSKTELNNFAVQATVLGQALIPQTGDWALAGADPRFNPFYARFASNPGTSTMLTDMIASLTNGGTFFMMWLGMDDVLLYSVYGGDPSKAPLTPLDGATGFTTLYNTALGGILMNPTLKGVVANFPDLFTLPHFTSVPYNPIVFTAADQAKIDQINAAYAAYNGGLDLALAGGYPGLTQDEVNSRKIQFAVGANASVIEDESLTDLTGLGLPSIREATSTDKFPLTTGSVLGEEATPGNPATVWGVTKALSDQYALVPSEITEINDRLLAFNTVVKNAADASDRVAFADVNKALKDFVTAKAYIINGVTITPGLAPPTGIYSEDGIHPNTRGYAFIAGVFVDAINTKFGASIPKPNIGKYGATGLPINP